MRSRLAGACNDRANVASPCFSTADSSLLAAPGMETSMRRLRSIRILHQLSRMRGGMPRGGLAGPFVHMT
ncbi:hypothetical protein FZ025_11730 [Xanthomonas hyacinthi]|nr:hypothetical protein FZ025_11730 [Xanthomonas hyacinthi]